MGGTQHFPNIHHGFALVLQPSYLTSSWVSLTLLWK